MKKAVPIGHEFFDLLISKNLYYVDKTLFIAVYKGNPKKYTAIVVGVITLCSTRELRISLSLG